MCPAPLLCCWQAKQTLAQVTEERNAAIREAQSLQVRGRAAFMDKASPAEAICSPPPALVFLSKVAQKKLIPSTKLVAFCLHSLHWFRWLKFANQHLNHHLIPAPFPYPSFTPALAEPEAAVAGWWEQWLVNDFAAPGGPVLPAGGVPDRTPVPVSCGARVVS